MRKSWSTPARARTLHRSLRYQTSRRAYAFTQSRCKRADHCLFLGDNFCSIVFLLVASELFRTAIGGRLRRVLESHAPGEHSTKLTGRSPDRHQVPRAARNAETDRVIRIVQKLRR
jgi:hypothetical protein